MAQETGTTGEYVLNRVIEHMPKSQNSRDVGWRYYNRVSWFGGSGVGEIVTPFHPLAIQPVLDLGGIVGWGEFRHESGRMPSLGAGEKPSAK